VNKTLKLVLLRLWLPVAIVAAWWVFSAGSTSLYFPPLSEILETVRVDWLGPFFLQHLVPSVGKFLAGYLIAVTLGVVVGMLIGLSPIARAVADPLVQFLRALPPVTILPVGILLFGIGASMNIFVIVFGAVWATLLNTADGVRGVDLQVRDTAKSFRLTWPQRIRHVLLPAAGPQIFAGMRTSLQIAIILIVVSEMVGATSGIGYSVLKSQQTFKVVDTWAATIVLGVLGFVMTVIFLQVEKRVLAWQAGMRANDNVE